MDKFIFIERDGLINVQKDEPIKSLEDFVFMPFVFEAFYTLEQNRIKPIIVTMQEGLETGTIPPAALKEIHQHMCSVIAENQGRIYDIFVCPVEGMPFDKLKYPSSNLLRLASRKHHIELSETFFLTNRYDALQAGWEADCKTGFVRTGKVFNAKRQVAKSEKQPDINVRDLLSGVLRAIDYYKQNPSGAAV